MDLQMRLDELLRVAGDMGLAIRREPLGGEGGGFCVVKGEQRLFVDTMADVEAQYERTLDAIAGMPEIETRYLCPEVRQDVEKRQADKGGS